MTTLSTGEHIAVGDVSGWIRTERDAPFNVVEFSLRPGAAPSPRHVHDRIYEVDYVLEGRVTARIGGRSEVLEAGAFIPIRPGTAHSVVAYEQPARILALHSPGADAWLLFERLGHAFRQRPTPEQLAAFLDGIDIRFVAEPEVSDGAGAPAS